VTAHTPSSAAGRAGPGASPRGRAGTDSIANDLAMRQHGIVTRRQLLDAGISSGVVDRRVRARTLRAVHPGVYRVGPVAAAHSLEMAAVLACGDAALLSHLSAAALWEMLPVALAGGAVDVALGNGHRRPSGVRVHRLGTLRPDHVTTRAGIPVTVPARTLFDIARQVSLRTLEQAWGQALALRLATPAEVDRLLAPLRGQPGSLSLRAIVGLAHPGRTRSEAEERFLALVRRARLDPPTTNTPVAGYEVDFLWPRERLVVEIDGFAFHASAASFERDRRRDAELTGAGMRVIRVTWRQLADEPEAVLARLVRALALAGRL